MDNAAVGRYLKLMERNPGDGGMVAEAAMIMGTLLQAQNNAHLSGGMAEIGVYYGFGAALMAAYLREDQPLVLVDPMAGPELWGPAIAEMAGEATMNRATFVQSDSLVLEQQGTADLFNGARFVHIDGEHSYDAVSNDLDVAARRLAPHGIVAVDDFFSAPSAGITEAVFDFVKRPPCRLSIFLIGYNKAYLCTNRWLGFYRDVIKDLPDILAGYGRHAMLVASGFAHERTYMGISPRAPDGMRYQLVGKRTDRQGDVLSSTNRFG